MRLLNVTTLKFAEFLDDKNRPQYAIVSHRWGKEEATYEDVRKGRNKDSAGYQKVEAFARYVQENMVSVNWLWIDTCCINKQDAVELSYAINSMFKWYRNAELCIAQLASIATGTLPSDIGQDEWFRRGWTLQELLAPRLVVFLTKDWLVIGNKGSSFYHCEGSFVGPDLGAQISSITRIPKRILDDWEASSNMRVQDKMLWMEGRTTSREEDIVYALFGVVGVTLSVIYGEGASNAKHRVLAELRQRNEVESQRKARYQEITEWLRSSDPWTNHESARRLHEQGTGEWLLQTKEYQAWKSGEDQCLWLYGGAGCGKTVLCSTVIEDMKTYCERKSNVGYAVFYFSFSDERKQSYEDLLTSLVAQLGHQEPAFSILQQMYDKIDSKSLGQRELERVLHTALASYDQVFCHLDALDECPERNGARQRTIENIERLLQQAPNMYLVATSRDELEIRDFMGRLNANSVLLASKIVNSDIQRYVSKQLARIPKLSRLDASTKELVERTLTDKADGMFRWVFCQLQALTKSKRTNPSVVKAALLALPATLDETYKRMLQNIAAEDRSYALTILRWLAYAPHPLSLDQLAEASIIHPSDYITTDDVVDIGNRGGWEDTLDILVGLIVTVETRDDAMGKSAMFDDIGHVDDRVNIPFQRPIEKDTKVRLAHFSVKEYLESSRSENDDLQFFHLDPGREHYWITQSCLVYLTYYSACLQKRSCRDDIYVFPLLDYAVRGWCYHAQLQNPGDYSREVQFLTNEKKKYDWLLIDEPDMEWKGHTVDHKINVGSAVYYAAFAGLWELVEHLVKGGADVNASGGIYGNAVQAASYQGDEKGVRILLSAGADVNAQGGRHGNALQAASYQGHENIAQILINAGAFANAKGGSSGNSLQAASGQNHKAVMRMLLGAGADVNAQSGHYGNALQAASFSGHVDAVQLLLSANANVNTQGGYHGNALQAASHQGHKRVIKSLLEAGADVNAQGGYYDSALQSSILKGYGEGTQLLLDAGANVNAQGGYAGNALQAACRRGYEDKVQMLLDAGADINAQGGHYGNALQAASSGGHDEMVQMLLKAGAETNAQGGYYGSALQAAATAYRDCEKVVQVLLDAGAIYKDIDCDISEDESKDEEDDRR